MIGCQWSTIAEILKSIMASDTACRYLGRRAEALSLIYADACVLPIFGTLAASRRQICPCVSATTPWILTGHLPFFECLCTIFLCLRSCHIAASLPGECDAYEEVRCYLFTLAALYWRLGGRYVYRETGAECCFQPELLLLCGVLAG